MNKNIFILTALTAVLTLSNKLNAQTISLIPARMEVFMELNEASGAGTVNDTLFAANAQVKGRMVIVLQDSSDISKIYVKLGNTAGSSDLLTRTFNFDQSGTFADGTSYKREGLIIYLGLGTFTGLNVYYGEARLEDANGVSGTSVTYNNN